MTPTAEQLEIQALARDFADSELSPRAREWDDRRSLPDEVLGKLAELGFLGMLVPDDFGGLGFELTTYAMVLEELARGEASVARSVALHNGVATHLARHGTQEQRSGWLPVLADGSVLATSALGGVESGLEERSVAVRAVPDGEDWRLDGRVEWMTNGARAGLVMLVAETGGGALGFFLVAPPAAGYAAGEREPTLGLRASEFVSVELEGVRVGADGVVGAPGSAFDHAADALSIARLGTAAQALGIGRAAMEHAIEYALGREQFGEAIASFGAIRAKLAGMAERLAAGRALTVEAAVALQGGGNGLEPRLGGLTGATARAAMAKLVASEAATWVADEAVQVFGGYGYMKHYPVEKLLRDAKGTEITEGTSETLEGVIARELLRDVEDPHGVGA